MGSVSPSYEGHRYPVEVISHCVWLYFRFPLGYREVEELMLQRGVIVSCETVRQWCAKFGQAYADGLRRRRPRPGDTWHLDEVLIEINGVRRYLWRAVGQDGSVLDVLVQSGRDTRAAKRFMAKLMKKQCRVPRVPVTDRLRPCGAAHRKPMPSVEHRAHKGLNNRAENSHQGVVTLADRPGMILELVVPGRGSLVSSAPPSYKGHRYPVEIIAHCVWLYFRFPLSFREVEELLLERGVTVSHETVRRWCAKFGQTYANGLRRRRPRPGDKWHLDEVFVRINGEPKYLWRAVDADGNVLDILVQGRRDKAAARRFFRKLLKKTRAVPRVVITDKLRSYGAAHREVMPSVEHRSHKGLNNRAENSHQPTRQRERAMKGFRSVGGAQQFLSAFSGISPHFRPYRHRMPATEYRAEMITRFAIWDQVTGVAGLPTAA